MMMQGRAPENPSAGELEKGHLEEHRDGLGNKDSTDQHHEQFLLAEYGDKPQGAAKTERADISHEDLRRMAIEPEKPQAACLLYTSPSPRDRG